MEGLVENQTGFAPQPASDRGSSRRRVLVAGADGYIGSVLCPLLADSGFDVTGLDTGFYQSAWLYHDGRDHPRMVNRDIRTIEPGDVAGFDAVIQLAELSNDPLCGFDESLTLGINHGGSVRLAKACKAAGVEQFVYASSCSVYGAGGADIKDETSPTDPQTVYARCKVMVEESVSALADSTFSPTFLRFATAFGASPRMRFDIVLNNLAGLAWTTGKVAMTSDGMPWRPLVHVQDISRAIMGVLEAPREAVFREVFNVGDDAQNYRVWEIAEVVADTFPDCDLTFGSSDGDNRSYRVSFAKIGEHLPGFRCEWDVRRGAEELRRIFEAIHMPKETFESPPFTRLKLLQQLLSTGQLTPELHWCSP
jgi:nucleoside-diphosphate-sugar epimerase